MGFFSRRTSEQKFWDWFTKNSQAYVNGDTAPNQGSLVATLATKLRKVNRKLVFQIGGLGTDSDRELEISADGDKKLFPTVLQLVECAPIIPRWHIVAFRQPWPTPMTIRYDSGLELSPDDVYFDHTVNGELIDVNLHVKKFEPTDEWLGIVFVVLDGLLGEFDTEMYLGAVQTTALSDGSQNLRPVTELTNVMREHKAELERARIAQSS